MAARIWQVRFNAWEWDWGLRALWVLPGLLSSPGPWAPGFPSMAKGVCSRVRRLGCGAGAAARLRIRCAVLG